MPAGDYVPHHCCCCCHQRDQRDPRFWYKDDPYPDSGKIEELRKDMLNVLKALNSLNGRVAKLEASQRLPEEAK